MKFPIIDTHTHGYFSQYDRNRDEMIQRAKEAGVIAQIQVGVDEASSLAAVKLATQHKKFFATLGVHPCDVQELGKRSKYPTEGFGNYPPQVKNFEELFELFEEVLAKNSQKIVGIGETGFDRYHDSSEELFEMQKISFRAHLKFSRQHNLPIVIHTRNAKQELLEFLEKNVATRPISGVIHCFSEDATTAKILTEKYGFLLGIGGVITYNNASALRESVEATPIEFLITETDAPFLTPKKFRTQTKINEPSFLAEVVEKIAEIKNMPVNETAEILVANAKKLFRI